MTWHYWLIRAAWLIAVLLLTEALLTPDPGRPVKEVIPEEAVFSVSKTVHVGSYAFLTVLLALSRWPRWGTWLGLAFLSLHAAGTEYGQLFVPGRIGCWSDVGIDHLGIGLGLVLSWLLCWRRSSPRSPIGGRAVS